MNKYIIQPGGLTVKLVNPFDNEFERTVPELYHTNESPLKEGLIVDGEQITQLHSLLVGWVDKSEVKDISQYIRETRQAVKIVQPVKEPIEDRTVEESNRMPLEHFPKLAYYILHAANNWKTDNKWSATLEQINNVCTIALNANQSAQQERERIVGLIGEHIGDFIKNNPASKCNAKVENNLYSLLTQLKAI